MAPQLAKQHRRAATTAEATRAAVALVGLFAPGQQWQRLRLRGASRAAGSADRVARSVELPCRWKRGDESWRIGCARRLGSGEGSDISWAGTCRTLPRL